MKAILLDFLIGVSGLVLGYLTNLLRPTVKSTTTAANARSWSVWVGPAVVRDRYDYYERGRPMEDEIAVRLRRDKESQAYGTVKIKDVSFDAKLNALVCAAEERCASLNAAYDEVGR